MNSGESGWISRGREADDFWLILPDLEIYSERLPLGMVYHQAIRRQRRGSIYWIRVQSVDGIIRSTNTPEMLLTLFLQPAPWPCWVIAASNSANPTTVSEFLTSLGKFAAAFDSAEKREIDDVKFVSETFSQQEEDVKEWLKSVSWYGEQKVVEKKVVLDTLRSVVSCPTVQTSS